MEEIAREAGLSKGALYLVFSRKEELYLAIAQRSLNELIERWTKIERNPNLDGFGRYKALLESNLDYALTYRDRFRVALGWSSAEYAVSLDTESFSSRSPAATVYRDALMSSFRPGYEALELGKKDGSVRADLDTTATLFHVWHGTVGMLMAIYGSEKTSEFMPATVDHAEMLRQHVAALLMNIKRAPSAEEQIPHLCLNKRKPRDEKK
jgi:AcrR family transcriptional regulator